MLCLPLYSSMNTFPSTEILVPSAPHDALHPLHTLENLNTEAGHHRRGPHLSPCQGAGPGLQPCSQGAPTPSLAPTCSAIGLFLPTKRRFCFPILVQVLTVTD